MSEKLIPRFKQVREQMGLAPSKFAEYLSEKTGKKIHFSKITSYERGGIYPKDEELEAYAKALDVTKFYLSGQGLTEAEIPDFIKRFVTRETFKYPEELTQIVKEWTDYVTYLEQLNTIRSGQGTSKALGFGLDFKDDLAYFLAVDDNLTGSLVGMTEIQAEATIRGYIKEICANYKRFRKPMPPSNSHSKSSDLMAAKHFFETQTIRELKRFLDGYYGFPRYKSWETKTQLVDKATDVIARIISYEE